jgi:hypothetical protein
MRVRIALQIAVRWIGMREYANHIRQEFRELWRYAEDDEFSFYELGYQYPKHRIA